MVGRAADWAEWIPVFKEIVGLSREFYNGNKFPAQSIQSNLNPRKDHYTPKSTFEFTLQPASIHYTFHN
jgi:hypothetical protein